MSHDISCRWRLCRAPHCQCAGREAFPPRSRAPDSAVKYRDTVALSNPVGNTLASFTLTEKSFTHSVWSYDGDCGQYREVSPRFTGILDSLFKNLFVVENFVTPSCVTSPRQATGLCQETAMCFTWGQALDDAARLLLPSVLLCRCAGYVYNAAVHSEVLATTRNWQYHQHGLAFLTEKTFPLVIASWLVHACFEFSSLFKINFQFLFFVII